MSEDADYLFALQMHRQLNGADENNDIEESVDFKYSIAKRKLKQSNPHSNLDEDFLNRMDNLVHPRWETLDPTPDIHSLFGAFDSKFFQGRLKCVTVEWSKRMYSCAGICYSRSNRFGLDVTIRLSEPLLKLRPRKDLVETMLHEMIHAYCFVLKIREGNGGHGPYFKKIMHGINKVAGTNITVYHTFHDEVDLYKQHWWRCNGICQNRAPFFGYVKRTSNRAPGPNDQWWAAHIQSCGGTFMKIKGPENRTKDKSVKVVGKEKSQANASTGSDLRKYFTPQSSSSTAGSSKSDPTNNRYSQKNSTAPKKNGFKGPMGSNGGGTLLLNPNTKDPSLLSAGNTKTDPSIATSFPPSSYPGLSGNPFNTNTNSKSSFVPTVGNLVNVKSLNDLKCPPLSSSNQGGKFGPVIPNNKRFSGSEIMGRGYSFSSGVSATAEAAAGLPKEVDRNHIRQLWSKRFSDNNNNPPDDDKKTTKDERPLEGDTKRRRTSVSNFKADEVKHSSVDVGGSTSAEAQTKADGDAWVVVDDDIMLQEKPEEIIALSSSSDDENDEVEVADAVDRLVRNKNTKLTANERQTIIKKEIIDESVGDSLTDDDIVLIDDDYNDDEDLLSDSVAIELADTSLIDDLFGEDTLLKEFKKENDVIPSGSRYAPNPLDDIITCPICQGKMKRSSFSDHLDGCTGITMKIIPPKAALKKLSTTSKQLKPSRKSGLSRQSAKEILRNAGYSEQDLLNITSGSSADDDDFLNTSTLNGSSQMPATITTVDLNSSGECDESSRRYRQRNIFKTTRQCPICAQEVEEDDMNAHLDNCLKARKKGKTGPNTT